MTKNHEAAEFEAVQRALLARWPEHQIAPDLTRIEMLCDLMASPQLTSPVIHIAGTNGKTSVARIIETLLRTMGLRTGLMTSPALRDLAERIVGAAQAVRGQFRPPRGESRGGFL